jgi:hypothetical protein
MQKMTIAKTFQQLVVGVFVDLRRSKFEFVGHVSANVQSKQLIYSDGNETLRNTQFDVLVDGVCDEIKTVFTGPAPTGRIKRT